MRRIWIRFWPLAAFCLVLLVGNLMRPMSETQAFWFTIALFAIAFMMAAQMSRWHLLQMMVFAAVCCSSVYWKWGVSGIATSIVGCVAAFIVTRAVYLVATAAGRQQVAMTLMAAVAKLKRAVRRSSRQRPENGPLEQADLRRRPMARD
jgi:hypothetical protein